MHARVNFRVLVLVWLAASTAAVFAAIANALYGARFVY